MARDWTAKDVLEIARAFQPACALAAGAELGVFDALAGAALTAHDLAAKVGGNPRATAMLADALTAMGLLTKRGDHYAAASGAGELLTERSSRSVLAMVRHLANCLRSWAQLAGVVRSGRRAERPPSVRGEQGDLEAFIEAMNDVSRSLAPGLVKALGPLRLGHLLDVGGGPGTWTIEFLRAFPQARATLFDLPEVIPIARRHIAEAGLEDRTRFVPGDLETDEPLPSGADLAWVSAIVHMNSREENRQLFAKVHAALKVGGRILIRDIVMDEDRTSPTDGAMFAINMLVNTPGGGTFTFEELKDDLLTAGFRGPRILLKGFSMDSVVEAVR
ncbi:MAG: methyltransferase domain-containing protein [Planctomycetes bacterium]|nr:methyltransferase domain-containing protein [Planctomycetota bacterium]